jgi:UDP-galactopyranose mutase
MYARYQAETQALPRIVFGGRLGTYRYMDMHQAIGAALVSWTRDVKPKLVG